MKKDVGESLIDSIRIISETNPGNMNSLLHPQLIDCSEEERTSRIRYEISPWELNQRGQVHGGAISAMFDVSMGVSIAAFSHKDVTTAEMAISYVRPFVGEAFDFCTDVVYLGSKLARVECKAYNISTGKLTATSHATFAYIGQIVTDTE